MALGKSTEPRTYAIGVIYDTILLNPAFGSLGPRLSNETQVELFSPDYISEKAVLIYVMVLGMMEQRPVPVTSPKYSLSCMACHSYRWNWEAKSKP